MVLTQVAVHPVAPLHVQSNWPVEHSSTSDIEIECELSGKPSSLSLNKSKKTNRIKTALQQVASRTLEPSLDYYIQAHNHGGGNGVCYHSLVE